MFGCEMPFESVCEPMRFLCWKGFIKCMRAMGVEIVNDQHNLLGMRISFIRYRLQKVRKVLQAAPISDFDDSFTSQWLHTHKDIGGAFAFILRVDSAHLSHSRWNRLTNF